MSTRHYTIVKGSDMIPQLSTVENDKGKWINFSYRGSGGGAISRLNIVQGRLSGMTPAGTDLCGIKFLISYDGTAFEKIEIRAVFTGENDFVVHHPSLEKGTREYNLTAGFRKADSPADWTKLKYVWLSSGKADMTFMLKRISMIANMKK